MIFKPGDLIVIRDFGNNVWWSNKLGIYIRRDVNIMYGNFVVVDGARIWLDESEFMKA